MKQKDIDTQISDLKSLIELKNTQMSQQKNEFDKTINAYIKEKVEADIKLGQIQSKHNQNNDVSNSDATEKKKIKAKAKNDKIIEDFINENERNSSIKHHVQKTNPFR